MHGSLSLVPPGLQSSSQPRLLPNGVDSQVVSKGTGVFPTDVILVLNYVSNYPRMHTTDMGVYSTSVYKYSYRVVSSVCGNVRALMCSDIWGRFCEYGLS